MKKVLITLVSLFIMINVGFGYTLTVNEFVINVNEGRKVTLTAPAKEGSIFINWEVLSGNLTLNNPNSDTISFTMPGNNIKLESVYKSESILTVNPGGATYTQNYGTTKSVTAPTQSYTVTYNYNGSGASNTTATSNRAFSSWTLSGGGNVSSTTTNPTTYTFGASNGTLTASYATTGSSVTLPTPTRTGYTFNGWYTASSGGTKVGDGGTSYAPTSDVTLYAQWEKLPWNAPVLGTGMTPVNWNGSSWEATTEANWDYNYNSVATATHSTVAGNGNGKWANAQTSDGSQYVWMPRYSYKITSGYHSNGNSWNSLDNTGTNKIQVKFSDGTVDDISNGYIAHPAFTFGSDELEGIWVAKYEASKGSGAIPKSKPGVVAWRGEPVSKAYDYAYNLNRELDSHLMRNSEWGAVAYLTNAIGRIPYKNNSSSYITGNAGGSQDASSASGVTNAWNTVGGVKASTTHNIYGIYDMSGGLWEFTSAYGTQGSSAYLSGDTSNKEYAGSLYTNRNTKYVETYTTMYTSGVKGDAIYETSKVAGATGTGNNTIASWDEDSSNIDSSNFVFVRGGCYINPIGAGVFAFTANNGGNSIAYSIGFRVVLAIP